MATLDERIAMLQELKECFFCDMEGADYEDFVDAETGYVACRQILEILRKGKEQEKEK